MPFPSSYGIISVKLWYSLPSSYGIPFRQVMVLTRFFRQVMVFFCVFPSSYGILLGFFRQVMVFFCVFSVKLWYSRLLKRQLKSLTPCRWAQARLNSRDVLFEQSDLLTDFP